MQTLDIDVDIHAGQRMVIESRKRFNHVRCHRRFGKSVLAYNLLAEEAGLGEPVAFVMPTATEYAKRWLECVQGLAPIISDVKVSDGVINLISGGRIEFFGLHRYDGMRGNHYKRVIIDEAAHSPNLEDAWLYVISPTLADLGGDAYFFSTPNGANYFKRLEEDNQHDGDWSFVHVPVTSEYRNPHLKQEEIDRQRKNLPSIVWQQEWLAEYVDMQGARIRREWLQWTDHVPANLFITMGVDLAISTKTSADYTACVVTGRADDGTIYVLDVQRIQQGFHGIINFITAMHSQWQPQVIGIESVQFQQAVVEELLMRGLPVQGMRPTKDKVTRFLPVEGKIEHKQIAFRHGLPAEFTDELLAFPEGSHDDMVDALVYSVDASYNSFQVITL